MGKEESVSIRLDLKGESLKRFLKLKNHNGFKTHASFIRVLISREYKREFENKDSEIKALKLRVKELEERLTQHE